MVVVPARPLKRRWWLHLLLFAATIFTTLVVGARLQFNFVHNRAPYATDVDLFPFLWALEDPARLWLGVPFSATLLLILLAHEMGHFLYCLRYGVRATLPFFVPAPTLIGTLGAFIRIRSRIPSRAALFDIGIAGPIAGFALAVPALALGLAWSKEGQALVQQAAIRFGHPLIFEAVWALLPQAHLPLQKMYLHPVAVAAWVGMFATALNLLPGGQLDGGHIVYALAPQWHRWISRLTVVVLLPLGVFFWVGWLVWAALLMATGTRHPAIPLAPDIGGGRRRLALLALLMLLLTFLPAPLANGALSSGP